MEKKPIKKNHIKESGGRNAPEASQGQIRDVWADLCGNLNSRGRTSSGQTGHMTGQMGHGHGTDATHQGGGSRQNSLCLLVFCFPQVLSECHVMQLPLKSVTAVITDLRTVSADRLWFLRWCLSIKSATDPRSDNPLTCTQTTPRHTRTKTFPLKRN